MRQEYARLFTRNSGQSHDSSVCVLCSGVIFWSNITSDHSPRIADLDCELQRVAWSRCTKLAAHSILPPSPGPWRSSVLSEPNTPWPPTSAQTGATLLKRHFWTPTTPQREREREREFLPPTCHPLRPPKPFPFFFFSLSLSLSLSICLLSLYNSLYLLLCCFYIFI